MEQAQAEEPALAAEKREHVRAEVVVQPVWLRMEPWGAIAAVAVLGSLYEEAAVEAQVERDYDWEALAVQKPYDRL